MGRSKAPFIDKRNATVYRYKPVGSGRAEVPGGLAAFSRDKSVENERVHAHL